jgi:hypothetical protein
MAGLQLRAHDAGCFVVWPCGGRLVMVGPAEGLLDRRDPWILHHRPAAFPVPLSITGLHTAEVVVVVVA